MIPTRPAICPVDCRINVMMCYLRIHLWCFAFLQMWIWTSAASSQFVSIDSALTPMILNDHSRFFSSSKLLDFLQSACNPVGDPFVWHRTGSNEAVNLYAYKAWLPGDKVTQLLSSASYEAYTHRGELLISEPLQFRTDNVQLVLTPQEGMTWRAWSTAL